MRKAAKALIVIGIVIGVFGLASSVLVLLFGGSIMAALRSSPVAGDAKVQSAMPALEQATDTSLPHVAAVAGLCLIVLAGAVLGLVATAKDGARVRSMICAGLTVACGLALLGFRDWIVAGAYAVGGFLALLAADRGSPSADGDSAPQPPSA